MTDALAAMLIVFAVFPSWPASIIAEVEWHLQDARRQVRARERKRQVKRRAKIIRRIRAQKFKVVDA